MKNTKIGESKELERAQALVDRLMGRPPAYMKGWRTTINRDVDWEELPTVEKTRCAFVPMTFPTNRLAIEDPILYHIRFSQRLKNAFGYIRPFGKGAVVKIQILALPEREDIDHGLFFDYDLMVDDIIEALDYREKALVNNEDGTRTSHRLGLITDRENIARLETSVRAAEDGEICGFWIRIFANEDVA